jgi:hypothetical protein
MVTAQQPIELILLRQWASYMAIPTWVMDVNGDRLFYNEPAELILGRRFEEQGPIHAEAIAATYVTTTLDGEPIPDDRLPLANT